MRIDIEQLSVRFGSTLAVDSTDLAIDSGELLALVGPSGCGKTTTLNFVAGFIRAASGRLRFDGDDVTDVSPRRRNLGLVFQDYAIYPHMTVEENIRFPLDVARTPRASAAEAVRNTAELVGVVELLRRRPHELSGGQRQRVALARALVKRPRALLLDEPLSNLDAHLRVQTRAEIRRLQSELRITTVFVTHDQSEALAIADRVVVMAEGRIVALKSPDDLYSYPPSLTAARFIGSPQMNLWDLAQAGAGFAHDTVGRLLTAAGWTGPDLVVGVRPEHAVLQEQGVPGTVVLRETLGRDVLLHVTAAGSTVRALVGPREAGALRPGDQVRLDVAPANWHFFAAQTGTRLEGVLPGDSGSAAAPASGLAVATAPRGGR